MQLQDICPGVVDVALWHSEDSLSQMGPCRLLSVIVQLSTFQTYLLYLPAVGPTDPRRMTLVMSRLIRDLNVFVYWSTPTTQSSTMWSQPTRHIRALLREPWKPTYMTLVGAFVFYVCLYAVQTDDAKINPHIFFFLLIIQYCNIFNIK